MEPSYIRERESRSAAGRDNLFVWTIFLLALAAIAFACWLGSFYVFGHPEQPRSYRLLRKLNKLPPPARFLVTKAPPGDFLDAQKIFERYSKFTHLQLERENQIYLRNYIKNYTETKKLVPYLTGKFQVLSVYELRPNDFFPSGVVALTQAVDSPQVLAELVYTANSEHLEDIRALLRPGVEIRLDRTLDLSAVVHVGRSQDGRLHLTVVPLLYGQYALKNGLGSFSLEPPRDLNVGSGLPLIRGEEVRAVFREQMEQRKKRMAGQSTAEAPAAATDAREVVRMDAPKPVPTGDPVAGAPAVPASSGVESGDLQAKAGVLKRESADSRETRSEGEPPERSAAHDGVKSVQDGEKNRLSKTSLKPAALDPVAAPPRAASQAVSPSSTPSVPPKVVAVRSGGGTAAAGASKAPGTGSAGASGGTSGSVAAVKSVAGVSPGASAPVAPAAAGASPPPRVMPVAAAGAGGDSVSGGAGSPTAGRPVVVAAPSMSAAVRPESWRVYSPGKQPQGRSVSLEQAVSLRGRNDGAPVYLRGKFLVTAADRNQAVMRQESADGGGVPTRVIVEYPAGTVPPARGSSVLRSEGRGFEIREVRRGADGQVNIYVREVFAQ